MRLYSRLGRYYDRFSKRYGDDYRALNWTSPDSQQKRFKVIASFLPGTCTINDVGCGHGDLLFFLAEEQQKSIPAYWGYELSQRVLNNIPAQIKSKSEASFFHVRKPELLFTADYSIASGIFNTNFRLTFREHHLNSFEEVIKAMWSKSSDGIVFNLLTRTSKHAYDGLFYFDRSYVEDFLASNFTDKFEVRSNYDPVDMTFFVSKS